MEELLETLVEILRRNVDPDSWNEPTIQEPMIFNRNMVIRQTPANHIKIGQLLRQLREAQSVLISVEARFLLVKSDWFEEIGVDLDLYFNTNDSLKAEALKVDSTANLSDFFITDPTSTQAGQLKDAVIYGSIYQQDPANPGSMIFPLNTINYGFGEIAPDPGNPQNIIYQNTTGFANPAPPIRLGGDLTGWSPIGVVNNSLSMVESLAAGIGTKFANDILSGAPALGFGMQYLDDIQVDLLVKATQADERSTSLDAPRLTFFNGQGAWIAFTNEQAYVSGLTAVGGTGSGAFEPEVGTINTGIMLYVKGAASADRRYVTMNVNFQKSQLDTIATSASTGAAGGGGLGGGAAGFAGTVQLPTISVQQLRVTTSVPDKGTALLGGYRTSQEFETEAGVPLLSKIPYINRFFANRITGTSERTNLILLRPEIILQPENEDQLFPGLNESLRLGAGYYQQ